MHENRELLIWDGGCGFCRACVSWLTARDRGERFTAQPYQNLPDLPGSVRKACESAIHVQLYSGEYLRGANAVLYAWSHCGGGLVARFLRVPPMIWAGEGIYWLVARNRGLLSRILFRNQSCELPPRPGTTGK